jgi:hypothetical protein
MERINFRKSRIPFTQVANEVLNNPTLSLKAKGLYSYLYSKPDGWDFAIERIAKETLEGEKSIRTGIHELEKHGYLYRERQASGRVLYLLHTQLEKAPLPKQEDGSEPPCQNAPLPKRPPAVSAGLSNTDNKIINKGSNIYPYEHSSQEIVSIIDAFAEWNPAAKQWYKRPPQRQAVDRLLSSYGQAMVLKVVALLRNTNSKRYFPTITTPVQLEEKWTALEAAFVRYKQENNINVVW